MGTGVAHLPLHIRAIRVASAVPFSSILATLKLWQINPRQWLQWDLQSCAETRSQAPKDIEPFLPWNLSSERRMTLCLTALEQKADTS